MNQQDALQFIEKLELKTSLNNLELQAFEQTIQSKGFALYLGLLLGSKQAHLVALANAQLGTSEKSCQASVVQGVVKGIDLALETIVEQFTPAEKDLSNGLRPLA